MAWKTSSVMEEKLRFIFEHELRERTMTELCEGYEITRQTGYVWLRRYREAGVAGLAEYSRAAHRHRNQMPGEIEQRVLGLRQAHMRWGPRKLKHILERDEPGRSWPAASTIGALLQREGFVVPRQKRLRIAAGHPEQNGRHERMHRTLKQEVAEPPAANRRKQQRALDRFRQEYNEVRPHEALGMRTPAEVYASSARKFPEHVLEPEYPVNMLVRSVRRKGHFRWKQDEAFLSEVLWGERVGLLQENDRWFTVYFAHHPIALFDSLQLRVAPLLTNSQPGDGEGEASPSPSPRPSIERNQKASHTRPGQ